jgi:hypothetical protein
MTRRRPAAAGPIPGRSMPPASCWGVSSEGHLPANRRPAVPIREHQSGGQPTHAAPARHADHQARPPPASRPGADDHTHHHRGAQAGALTLTAVPTSERRTVGRCVGQSVHRACQGGGRGRGGSRPSRKAISSVGPLGPECWLSPFQDRQNRDWTCPRTRETPLYRQEITSRFTGATLAFWRLLGVTVWGTKPGSSLLGRPRRRGGRRA